MFLSKLSEKSHIALVPLGIGSAFNAIALNTLSAPAIAALPLSPETHIGTRLFSHLFAEDAAAIAADRKAPAFSHSAIGSTLADSLLDSQPLSTVESSYQPKFTVRPIQKRSKHNSLDSYGVRVREHSASQPTVQDTQALTLSKLLAAIDNREPPKKLIEQMHTQARRVSAVSESASEATPSGPTVTPSFSASPLSSASAFTSIGTLLTEPKLTKPDQASRNQAEPQQAFSSKAESAEPQLDIDLLVPRETRPAVTPAITATTTDTAKNRHAVIEAPAEHGSTELAQIPDLSDLLPERSPNEPERIPRRITPQSSENELEPEDDLGELRLQLQRSRKDEDEDLGILRLRQTAQAPPPPPSPPIAFASGRLGFFGTENAFRFGEPVDSQIYQAGLSVLFFPKLSKTTNLYAIAETNIARYSDDDVTLFFVDGNGNRNSTQLSDPDYNEVEVQLGLRQKLFSRTYAQLGWRNQVLFDEGYRNRKFSANYIDAQLTHRAILGSRTWLDGFYQARIGFTTSPRADRFRQTFTLSLNHRLSSDLRTGLLYQLDFADYTRTSRFDTYQQILGVVSYNLTPESRVSLFGGTRFGRSSNSNITLDDTFYGASLNVTVPLF